jgi:predicted GIY-YIG superfamily endonuclease
MTATQDNTQSLPQKAGVYIIRDATLPEYTLYVGIASNLRTRLSSSHQILKYCRDRGIDYTIDWELEPNEKKRKKREHQLISELDAKLNDGGVDQSSNSKPTAHSSKSSDPIWQYDVDSFLSRIVEKDLFPGARNIGTPGYRWCLRWLDFAWENLYKGRATLAYGMGYKNLHKEVERELSEFTNWFDYLTNSSRRQCGGLNHLGSGIIKTNNQGVHFWFEPAINFRGFGSYFILETFAEALYGECFDAEALYGECFDCYNPKGLESKFKEFLMYLNPGIADQWDRFKGLSKKAHGFKDAKFWMGDIIQDFCDHALKWSVVNDIPLFHHRIPKETLFTKFFLGKVYKQKLHVEYHSKYNYIPVFSFFVAANECFDAYRLQYRLPSNYLEDIELRLTT